MNNDEYIKFPCIEVIQPIGTFYVGVINHDDLVNISYADIRKLENRELDKYLGIERTLSKSRVNELKKYVNLIDASFPSSIILAVPRTRIINAGDDEIEDEEETVRYNPDTKIMEIKNDRHVAKIIDGQHRIAGLDGFNNGQFQLNVTIFVDMDIEDQAMVFATINFKQMKVSKSLQYDLYEYAKSRSPQKTAHDIARLLNKKEGSPFYRKIKVLGMTEDVGETITQAAFVDRLLPYISWNPMEDRDLIKRGKKLSHAEGKSEEKYIFRNFFIGENDAIIAGNIWNYFKAVSEKWPDAWNKNERGFILNRTTGLSALMRLLRPVYNNAAKDLKGLVEKGYFTKIFNKIKLKDGDFTPEKYRPGSSGAGQLYRELARFLD